MRIPRATYAAVFICNRLARVIAVIVRWLSQSRGARALQFAEVEATSVQCHAPLRPRQEPVLLIDVSCVPLEAFTSSPQWPLLLRASRRVVFDASPAAHAFSCRPPTHTLGGLSAVAYSSWVELTSDAMRCGTGPFHPMRELKTPLGHSAGQHRPSLRGHTRIFRYSLTR